MSKSDIPTFFSLTARAQASHIRRQGAVALLTISKQDVVWELSFVFQR
jgi:hypothetical protein